MIKQPNGGTISLNFGSKLLGVVTTQVVSASYTGNPTLRPQEVRGFLVWERHAARGKTIDTQKPQGTLEASR
eukprot:2478848-Pyramimonas_sp.AAC.1